MRNTRRHLTGVPVLILIAGCSLMLSIFGRIGADDETHPGDDDTRPVAEFLGTVYTDANMPEAFEPSEWANHLLRLASLEVRSRISTEWSPLTEEELDEEIYRRIEEETLAPFTEEIRLFVSAYNQALAVIKEQQLDDPDAIREAFEQARSGIDEFTGYYLEGVDTTFMDENAWRNMVESTIAFQGDRATFAPMAETEEEHFESYRASMANLLSGPAYVDPLIDAHKLMESEKHREVARAVLEENPDLDRDLDEVLRIMLQGREFDLFEFRMIEEHLIVHDETVAEEVSSMLAERRKRASDLQNYAHRPMNPLR